MKSIYFSEEARNESFAVVLKAEETWGALICFGMKQRLDWRIQKKMGEREVDEQAKA